MLATDMIGSHLGPYKIEAPIGAGGMGEVFRAHDTRLRRTVALPQVLAGLGLFSLLNAGCLFWLQRLQPLFFTVAVGSLLYQLWIVRRRPATLRRWGVKTILALSLALNVLVVTTWIVLSVRYR